MLLLELPTATWRGVRKELQSAVDQEDYLGIDLFRQAWLTLHDLQVANFSPPDEVRVDPDCGTVVIEWRRDGRWSKEIVIRMDGREVAMEEHGEVVTAEMDPYPGFAWKLGDKE